MQTNHFVAPPEDVMCRSVRQAWVTQIKAKMTDKNTDLIMRLPVKIAPDQCTQDSKIRGRCKINGDIVSPGFLLVQLTEY